MKKLFAGYLLLLVNFNADAQAKSSRVSFTSISKVALAVGEANNALAVSCINGVQKGNWFEDPSNSSISCRQTGPITVGAIEA